MKENNVDDEPIIPFMQQYFREWDESITLGEFKEDSKKFKHRHVEQYVKNPKYRRFINRVYNDNTPRYNGRH